MRSGETSNRAFYIREVGKTTGEYSRRAHPGPERDSGAKAVCGQCNNGWMQQLGVELEVLGPQLLKGKSVRLTKAKQASLAAWAAKTILMFQCTHGREVRFVIPPEDYTQFYTNKAPSNLMHLWAGSMEPPGHRGGPALAFVDYTADELFYDAPDLAALGFDPGLACKGYCATLRVGNLVLGLLKAGSPELLEMHALRVPRQWVRIWPAVGTRDWPPQQRMQPGRVQPFVAYMRMRLAS